MRLMRSSHIQLLTRSGVRRPSLIHFETRHMIQILLRVIIKSRWNIYVTALRAGSGGGWGVGQGVVRVCIRGVAAKWRESVIIWRTSSQYYGCFVPDTAASLSSVKMSAPASGGAEARSGARAHWTRARAGLVGDYVDPHPHVGQALGNESAFQIWVLSGLFGNISKLIVIEKLFDPHVQASGNLDKVKSIKSQSDYIFLG